MHVNMETALENSYVISFLRISKFQILRRKCYTVGHRIMLIPHICKVINCNRIGWSNSMTCKKTYANNCTCNIKWGKRGRRGPKNISLQHMVHNMAILHACAVDTFTQNMFWRKRLEIFTGTLLVLSPVSCINNTCSLSVIEIPL